MKKILNFAAVAALALGAVSCTKDDNIGAGGGADVADGKKMTFTLPLPQKGITYAIADDDEMYVNPTTVRIYMFDNDSEELEAIINANSVSTEVNGGVLSATIERMEQWQGNKLFYFAVNRPTADNLPKALPAEGEPAIMKSDFLETLTIPYPQWSATRPSHLMTGVSEVVTDVANAPTVIPGDVSLYRSVARFDLDNDVTANWVTIKKIYVEHTPYQGYVFGYQNKPNVAENVIRGNMEDLDLDVPDGDNKQQQESLFYLQPTVIKGDGSGTMIKLLGEVKGVDKLFSLKTRESDGTPTDFVIEANKRYKISAIDPDGLTFNLAVADWEEGEEIVGKPDKGTTIGLIENSFDITDGTTEFDPMTNIFTVVPSGANFSFDVMSSTLKGANVEIITTEESGFTPYGEDKITVTTSTESTVTYAAPYYKTTVTVSIEGADIDPADNFMSRIRLRDAGTINSSVFFEFRVYHLADAGSVAPEDAIYPGTPYKAVKISDGGTTVYFAPVNVGATVRNNNSSNATVLTGGYMFQWGRNVPLTWPASTIQGPLTAEEAANTTAFIQGENMNSDWLSEPDDMLWSGDKAQGPCPQGWRVPTRAELAVLDNVNKMQDEYLYSVEGENGETLYFPVGTRQYAAGSGGGGYEYWSSEASGSKGYNLNIKEEVTAATRGKMVAMSVRCVLDVAE